MAGSSMAAVQMDSLGSRISNATNAIRSSSALPEKSCKQRSFRMGSFQVPGNPFEKWTASETCDLPDLCENDIVCSIFANYGEDLIVLMVAMLHVLSL
jgi:hypothetical protein